MWNREHFHLDLEQISLHKVGCGQSYENHGVLTSCQTSYSIINHLDIETENIFDYNYLFIINVI